jgi:hypothetical protein
MFCIFRITTPSVASLVSRVSRSPSVSGCCTNLSIIAVRHNRELGWHTQIPGILWFTGLPDKHVLQCIPVQFLFFCSKSGANDCDLEAGHRQVLKGWDFRINVRASRSSFENCSPGPTRLHDPKSYSSNAHSVIHEYSSHPLTSLSPSPSSLSLAKGPL